MKPGWLFAMALGIAVGVAIPFVPRESREVQPSSIEPTAASVETGPAERAPGEAGTTEPLAPRPSAQAADSNYAAAVRQIERENAALKANQAEYFQHADTERKRSHQTFVERQRQANIRAQENLAEKREADQNANALESQYNPAWQSWSNEDWGFINRFSNGRYWRH